MRHAELIYKIATPDVMAASRQRGLSPAWQSIADGFLHFSTRSSCPRRCVSTRGQRELVLLAVRAGDMGTALVWEPSRGGALFPHVYGAFPLSAVVHEAAISVDDAGDCSLPEWVR